MERFGLRNDQWERIEDVLLGVKGTWAARRKIIDCSSKLFSTALGLGVPGTTTKVHALVDALGNPCGLMLTPGQVHDLTCAQPLLENADPVGLVRCSICVWRVVHHACLSFSRNVCASGWPAGLATTFS